jgi:hypothetical protein
MSKTSSSSLTPSPKTLPPPPRLDLDAVLDCTYGHYPWDDWERYALACGLDDELAGLARLLIREAFQHDWPDWLKPVCGWSDDLPAPRLRQAGGQALLNFALGSPRAARRQWDILFRTDGLRGDYRSRSTEWVCGYLRADAQRLLVALSQRDDF